ncbi:MAG TPA: hypothetical protein VFX60_19405 [Micromonospora sp.]|nr:hypothetical protein [Micromonospora sp.]
MAEESTTTEAAVTAVEETPTPEQPARPDVPIEVKRALTKANKEAEALRLKLKEYEDRDKTEQQRLTESRAEAERRAADAEMALARYRVAVAKGLPADLVDRLRGSTEEELTADADKLLALVAPAKPDGDAGRQPGPRPDLSQGSRNQMALNSDALTEALKAAVGAR